MFGIYLLIGLMVLAAVLLVFAVLIQNSKGGGLASNMQGANVATQMFGARRGADVVEKLTWYLMGGIVVISFLVNILFASAGPATRAPQGGLGLDEAPAAATVPQAPQEIPSLEDIQQQAPATAPADSAGQ